MAPGDLQRETTEVLARLVQFNTVNPPGNERPAIEYLASYLEEAGFRTELLAAVDDRPNLVATLDSDSNSDNDKRQRQRQRQRQRRSHPSVPGPCRHGPGQSSRVAARPVVGRRGRRLPLGPRRDRHEIAGRRGSGRRGCACARGLASSKRGAEARVRVRRGNRRRCRRGLAHPDSPGQGPLRHAAQ